MEKFSKGAKLCLDLQAELILGGFSEKAAKMWPEVEAYFEKAFAENQTVETLPKEVVFMYDTTKQLVLRCAAASPRVNKPYEAACEHAVEYLEFSLQNHLEQPCWENYLLKQTDEESD